MSHAFVRYRPCVGIVLFNRDGHVLVGRRAADRSNPFSFGDAYRWQLPQGGIEKHEQPLAAARRELLEEMGVHNVTLLSEARDWLKYEFPERIASSRFKGRFQGQRQKWFAFQFDGNDGEINISGHSANGKPEFDAWRWEQLDMVPTLVIPFKKQVYSQIVEEFKRFSRPGFFG